MQKEQCRRCWNSGCWQDVNATLRTMRSGWDWVLVKWSFYMIVYRYHHNITQSKRTTGQVFINFQDKAIIIFSKTLTISLLVMKVSWLTWSAPQVRSKDVTTITAIVKSSHWNRNMDSVLVSGTLAVWQRVSAPWLAPGNVPTPAPIMVDIERPWW